jgi:phosphatidate cytidylyltransferase
VADDKRDGDDLFEDLDKFFAPIQDVDWPEPTEPAPASTSQEEHVAVRSGEPPSAPPPTADEPPPVIIDDDEEEDWYDSGVVETMAGDEAGSGVAGPDDTQADLFQPDAGANEDASVEPTEEDVEAAAAHFASSIDVGEPPSDASSGGDDDATAYPTDTVSFAPDEGEFVGVRTASGEAADTGDLFTDLGIGGAPVEGSDDILGDFEEPTDVPRTVKVGADGLGGPSWQEPASMEVGADIDRRGPNAGARDVPAAFMTGAVMAGVALAALLAGKGWFSLLAAVVVVAAQFELFTVMQSHHQQPATFVGLVTGALIMAGAYYKGEPAMLAMFGLGVIATFLWFMAVPAAHRKNLTQNIGLTILNIAWIPMLAGFLLIPFTFAGNDGRDLVLAVIGLTFVYDVAAFAVGAVWGGSFFPRPLAPATSPKKSWEGAIGATLITMIVAMSLVPSFVTAFSDKRIESFFLAIVVSVMATFGDLAESLIKRDVGIKDMGNVLPGHGGILDRIDSLLFVAPAAFLLFRVIFA